MTALRDWLHPVSDIGPNGLDRTRTATEDERIELARELDILACNALMVRYVLKPIGADRYSLSGTLDADVAQACVVTLEPVEAHLTESFFVEFSAAEALEQAFPVSVDQEVSSIPDVEPFENGRIEVGETVYAVLASSLDLYPRKEGADFKWEDPKIAAEREAGGAFAALAKLKRDD